MDPIVVFVLVCAGIVDHAARLGVTIDRRTHARVGAPVTMTTVGIAAVWLVLVR